MSRYVVALLATADVIAARADELNRLDGFAGDGDMGITMGKAAAALHEVSPQLESGGAAHILRTCGTAIARRAPSTSGTLIATGLLRAAVAATPDAAAATPEVAAATPEVAADAATLARLLGAARDAIAQRGSAAPGSKTMLDALGPAAEAAAGAAGERVALEDALDRAAAAADAGARATVSMQPRHGRAGWLPERSVGHEDAGARLVAMVLSAYASALRAAE